MLSTISWTSYTQAIAGLLAVYYLLVVYVYYWQEFLQFFSKRQPLFTKDANASQQYEPVQYLTDEISALISQATYSRSPKEEMLFALQKLLCSGRFQSIHESSFREVIENHIVNECQTNCSMHLSEEDLQRLWVSK